MELNSTSNTTTTYTSISPATLEITVDTRFLDKFRSVIDARDTAACTANKRRAQVSA